MDLAEAIKKLVPLQVRIPNPRKPLDLEAHYAAEVFLAETPHGVAVIWLGPYWCDKPDTAVAHIAYAEPVRQGSAERWVDNDPRFGPHCIPYQKPFVIERLRSDSAAWKDYKAWQHRRAGKGQSCWRRAAWERVEQELAELVQQRLT
ncbi:hypothetical protein [uncultured Thiohalocapsa sp.]|uniref:hypothetical protein n=1 Tax=uncultured Thiohalocapsa sp. TaxID=768990 RepID=UPI0025F49DAB|nr:hypothetical protein [uncultured Thiohalocapsa sp.]